MKMLILMVIGIWIGFVLGLSFLEAPLKFTAPGITTKLGLGIGRLVFGWSNKIQLGLLALIVISLLSKQIVLSEWGKLLLYSLVIFMGIQTLYLLPILDARVTKTLNDEIIPSSLHHLFFIALEIVKPISLILIFISLYRHE